MTMTKRAIRWRCPAETSPWRECQGALRVSSLWWKTTRSSRCSNSSRSPTSLWLKAAGSLDRSNRRRDEYAPPSTGWSRCCSGCRPGAWPCARGCPHAIEHLLVRKIDALPGESFDETVERVKGSAPDTSLPTSVTRAVQLPCRQTLIQEARAREGYTMARSSFFLGARMA